MTFQRIANYIAAEPFRPFPISMASGKTYEIRHPEMIAVGRTTADVFTAMSEDLEETVQREHEIPLMLIESIEPLDTSATQERN